MKDEKSTVEGRKGRGKRVKDGWSEKRDEESTVGDRNGSRRGWKRARVRGEVKRVW